MALSPVQAEKLSQLSKEQLLEFIDMLQKNWWNLQNNYILYINNKYGEEAAVDADAHCFPANAKVQMYRLRKLFGLKDDLQSLMDAMALSTIWANGEYEIRKIDEYFGPDERKRVAKSQGFRVAKVFLTTDY